MGMGKNMTPDIASILKTRLAECGVRLDGSGEADIRVHDPRLYRRIALHGMIGIGEAYMEGWWDCDRIDVLVDRIFSQGVDLERHYRDYNRLFDRWISRILNRQSRQRAFEVGRRHYDLGNDLYQAMLDRRMIYSCAYWKDAVDLDAAQEAKLDLVCRKIGLRRGQRVLDIGCGWGGFARFAVERYGARVVGITVSERQAAWARDYCAGLPVEIRFQDYRFLEGEFDHVVSIGMFEHVGPKNYRTYMRVVDRCLKPDGSFLLQTIGGRTSTSTINPWVHKYIFPNAVLPSATQITTTSEGIFVVEDWHEFGPYYDKTLMAWHRNFTSRWPSIRSHYDERFYRMWTFYLLSCAGSFRSRRNQLWQIVFSKGRRRAVYAPCR